MRKFVTSGLAPMIAGASLGILSLQASASSCEEGFDDLDALLVQGWSARNNSYPAGPGFWSQGDPTDFGALTGDPTSYASVGADSAAGPYTIVSDWLITPEILFGPNQYNAKIFRFYTRGVPGAANRLVVRLCLEAGSDVCAAPGPDPDDIGGFQTVLLDINPDMGADGYPADWTGYTIGPGDGLPVVGRGRIAFHYFVFPQPNGSHGTTIGVDAASVAGATVCPFGEVVMADGFDAP